MRWQAKGILAGVVAGAAYGIYRAVDHPQSKLFGSAFDRSAGARQFALTFDDGPDPEWTPRIAALLDRRRVPATFFCIGSRAERHPAIVRRLSEAGHEIGNHSYTHRNLWYRPASTVRGEIDRCQSALSIAAGSPPRVFRPPFGDRGPHVIREARRIGLATVLWSLDSRDWNNPPLARLLARVEKQARGGDILLFHDGSHDDRFSDRSSTLEAIDALIPMLAARQCEFVTVSAMMAAAGAER